MRITWTTAMVVIANLPLQASAQFRECPVSSYSISRVIENDVSYIDVRTATPNTDMSGSMFVQEQTTSNNSRVDVLHVNPSPGQVDLVRFRNRSSFDQRVTIRFVIRDVPSPAKAMTCEVTSEEVIGASPAFGQLAGGFDSDSLCSLFSDSSGFCGGGIDPIVLDLGTPGLDLTGLDDPVLFDIDADGTQEEISWTARGASDAFLALDRNGNGTIDDGMELFGDAIMLRDGSTSTNGYQALWEFDLEEFGGDGSGVIDANDAVFRRLLLWTDKDHDGVSDPGELRPLRSEGIVALSLQTEKGMELDEHGNFFGFISRAYAYKRQRGSVRRQFIEIPAIDVFFLV